MGRRAVSGMMLTLLLVGMLTLAFNIQPAKTEPSTIIVPDDYPTIQEAIDHASEGDTIFAHNGTYHENLIVNKTVSLVGEDKRNTTIDDNYTGTAINVTANNVKIINFTIQYNGIQPSGYAGIKVFSSGNNISYNIIGNNFTYGIWLTYHCSNNTISRNTITNNSVGIFLDHCSSNTISENSIINNSQGIFLGVSSNFSVVSGNSITNNDQGIWFYYSSNNILSGNMMNDNKYNFIVWGGELQHFMHSIDVSNLVDGKSVYYLSNQKGLVINPATHPQIGYLALVNCTNVTVEGLNLTNNMQGLLFAYTNNSRITDNTIINNWFGIDLFDSSNNAISGNYITANTHDGIFLGYSSNNTISRNNIPANNRHGLWLFDSSNNAISGNYITANNEGGIFLWDSSNNTISRNNITNNDYGIYIYTMSSDNFFCHNNFMNNTSQVYIRSYSVSVWDNGYPSGGNYWSDYEERYPNASEIDSSGIWDTPYVIDENNQDNYPLINPWTPPVSDSDVDWWPMFHHDASHTGYSTSTAPNTNDLAWNYTTGDCVNSSPAVADGRVYVGSDARGVYCLNASTGALIWNYTTVAPVYSSSPAVADGRVYVGSSDSKVHCLNASTGSKIWSYTTSNWIWSSPAVADGRVYVGSEDHNVYCLNASTGAFIWNYTTGDGVYSSSAVADGKVYVGSLDGKVYCLDALTGAFIWNYTTGAPVFSSPAVADGRVYVGSNDVYCLNATTGAFIWNYTTGDGVYSSSAVADGKVYVGSLDGKVYCFNASTGSFIWSYTTSDYVWSSPAVADGRVYVGSEDRNVYCLNASTGALIWNYTTGAPVYSSSPAVADGRVYVGSSDGTVYAFGAVHVKVISDLLISSPDVVFSDPNPSEGQPVTISATIHNIGETNIEGAIVQFFDATSLIGELQISSVSHHSQGTASVDWTAEGEGFHLIKVVVDPYHDIDEIDEDNNEATRSILIGEIPYFGGIVVNGSATPNETQTGSAVTVQGYAWYNTTYGAGEPVAGAEVKITVIEWKQWITHTLSDGTCATSITAPYSPGNYTLVVTVTDFTFWESIEIGLNVTQQTGVDLTLSYLDISFSPSDPIENEDVKITATIHNVGTDDASNVLVAFYDGGEHIGNETIGLISGGASEDTMISWNATPWGWHTITVVVDPENTTGEPPEARNNNEAYENIYVYPSLPDLTPTSIVFSDNTPLVNQTITISANVKNLGGVEANNILVSFNDNSQPINITSIERINGKGESKTASISYAFTTSGWHTINATADVIKNIKEADEGNNWHCRSIYVHLPSPDLTLSSSDITFSNSTPTTGDIITIYATIHNIGEVDAQNVIACFFDGDTRINCTNIPWINASGQETVDVAWNATPVGWHRIKVIIDENNTILESNENNNAASRYIYVRPELAADLYIHSEDIVFSNTNPDPGENVTIHATVHNIGEAEAQNVTVTFYIDDIQLGSPKTTPSIPVDREETVSTKWIASQVGSHVVKVIVDTPIESNKKNNNATRAIIVSEHDVAIINVTTSKTSVGQGYCTNVTVTIENQGDTPESFDVTVYADLNTTIIGDEIIIGNQTVDSLTNGTSTNITFTWDTNTTGTPLPKGNYTITAYAWPVPGETNTTDNTYIDGIIRIVIPGDVNADGKVDMKDIGALCICYNKEPCTDHCPCEYDINGDGKINMKDIGICCIHYGEEYP